MTGRVRTVGEVAHIFSVQPGGERHRPDMSTAERDAPAHLLILCPTCHDKIDKPGAAQAYPATLLLKWRLDREIELVRTVKPAFPFGFEEVRRVVRLLPRMVASDSAPAPPAAVDKKLQTNRLSEYVRADITRGLARSGVVSQYLQSQGALDPGVIAEIEDAMVDLYRKNRASLDSDALFYQICNELTYGLHQPQEREAAVSVLAWFFHTCDVFERPE